MAEVKDYAEDKIDINELAGRIRKEGGSAYAVQEAVQEAPAPQPEADSEDYDNSIDVDIDNIEFEVESDNMVDEDYEYYAEPHEDTYQETYEETYDDYSYGRRPGVSRAINKHVFTWLFSFVLGIYGGDRFFRGQIGLGVLKLLTFGGFGMWYLADWAIAMYKSYGGPFSDSEDVMFDRFGRYIY